MENYIPRVMERGILKVSERFPVLLVTGPRQVGKTTLLKKLCNEKREYVTLDDINLREYARNEPKLFIQQYPPPILIDEIQYAPELFPYIKISVDQSGRGGDYWLTGSQQFHMMRHVTESLAGRAAIFNLLGFSAKERSGRQDISTPFLPKKGKDLGSNTNPDIVSLYKEIHRGSFPGSFDFDSDEISVFFSSYLQTYIQRDVRELTQVGDINSFTRFLKVCAARTGQLVNYTDIAGDADVSVQTVKKWLSILEASFQIRLLYPYHNNITKRIVKTPKLYFLDTGFCSYLTGWSDYNTLMNGAMTGSILETYVFSEIMKSHWFNLSEPDIYFYRDRDKKEIDFLLFKNGLCYPVEVKRSANINKKWVRHFSTLDNLNLKKGTGAVVSLNEKPLHITDDIWNHPVYSL